MVHFGAIYDACVLYPAPLRDFLMQLALTDLFRAKWTNRIHDEWIRNVLRNRQDLRREQLERTRDLMNANVRDCIVEGFEPLERAIDLPDEDDRHVVAAAIKGQADVIVTFNLKDFPPKTLIQWDLEAQHPDEFIKHLISLAPTTIVQAAKDIRARLRNPPLSAEAYLRSLSAQGLPQLVSFLSGQDI